MSLFGAMTTAISGLNAQSRSLGHISDNIANSQTTGFKRVDTNFVDLVTQSSANSHASGSVLARPDFTHTVQGTVEQSDNPLGLAIGGQGFFSVAQSRGSVNGLPAFDERQFYTRAGDFRMDRDGYLVNGSNYFLQGWPIGSDGVVDRTTLAPVRVSQQVFNPISTSNVEMAANIPNLAPPATPGDARSFSTQVQVYDQVGNRNPVTITFRQMDTTPRGWNMTITPTPAVGGGPIPLIFGTDGTIASFNGVAGTANTPVELPFEMDFGLGNQAITLNIGRFSVAQGITNYAGRDFSLRNLSQNGVPPGAYSGLAVRENGDIAVNYDNGQSRIVARVPLVSFSDADKLKRLDGQGFMRTIESGEAQVTDAASNGVGKLVVGALEKSNVDIGTEFTKLIVAQRAYTANTKIVTAADEMLQDTINMKR